MWTGVRPCTGVTSTPGEGSTFWFTVVLQKVEAQHVELRQVSILAPIPCPILVVSANTSTRNMITGCLEAWGADVCAAVDEKEAATHLDGDLPPVTVILSLSLQQWQGLHASQPFCPKAT
jgi:PleD family two-component response regulator